LHNGLVIPKTYKKPDEYLIGGDKGDLVRAVVDWIVGHGWYEGPTTPCGGGIPRIDNPVKIVGGSRFGPHTHSYLFQLWIENQLALPGIS